jgi:Leucine-rich repeat (LRR) protein
VAWASKGDATEHRNDVVFLLRDWSPGSRLNQCLHLNGFGLKSVPPLPRDTLEVSLNGNALTTLAGVDWPPGLTRISAVGNKFAGTLDLDKELPESLTSVCLDDNNIEAVAASSHAKLKVLSLRRNQISQVGQHPPELTDWDVTGNRLTRITAGILSESLEHLRAADNQLYEVADDIEIPARLVLVELMNNNFHYFPNILLQLNKECRVDFSDNPIGERIRNWGLVQEDPFTFER